MQGARSAIWPVQMSDEQRGRGAFWAATRRASLVLGALRRCKALVVNDTTARFAPCTASQSEARALLPHQPEQAPALAGVERGAPRRPGQDLAEQPFPDRLALGGEHDVLAPPVPQGGFPPGQPVLLQGVRDRGDEGRVAAHPLAEFLHRQRGIELDQGDGVAAVHPNSVAMRWPRSWKSLKSSGSVSLICWLSWSSVSGSACATGSASSTRRWLEHPRVLVHVAHLRPNPLAGYLSTSIIE